VNGEKPVLVDVAATRLVYPLSGDYAKTGGGVGSALLAAYITVI